jgi:hypothetical protein
MKDLRNRIVDVSEHLQHLMDPAVFPEVQNAVENRDKGKLMEVCRKIRVPEIYRATIASVLLSVSPRQKWPTPET